MGEQEAMKLVNVSDLAITSLKQPIIQNESKSSVKFRPEHTKLQ